jgi:hypothetical protein
MEKVKLMNDSDSLSSFIKSELISLKMNDLQLLNV